MVALEDGTTLEIRTVPRTCIPPWARGITANAQILCRQGLEHCLEACSVLGSVPSCGAQNSYSERFCRLEQQCIPEMHRARTLRSTATGSSKRGRRLLQHLRHWHVSDSPLVHSFEKVDCLLQNLRLVRAQQPAPSPRHRSWPGSDAVGFLS